MMNSGIYIHIPFCKKKCLYCDFFSGGAGLADWEKYSLALQKEYWERKEEIPTPVDTLYFGGGTPSLMPDSVFSSMLSFFIENIDWGVGEREITMEVNPDDVNLTKALEWKATGITRISMGVQSMNDDELLKIGRRHNADGAKEAAAILRSVFDNISLDLMFGLPGQTLESWDKTIEETLQLKPDHISAYSLMFEEGTAMTLLRNQKRLSFPSDEDSSEMWRILSKKLEESGFIQYEISNYSLPGRESRHNNKYWRQAPYLGLGPSAHSYDGNRMRRFNPLDIKDYISHFSENDRISTPFFKEECLKDDELREEFILTRLRMTKGFSLDDYRERFGEEEQKNLLRRIMRLPNKHLIDFENGNISLSKEGIMVSDSIIVDLI